MASNVSTIDGLGFEEVNQASSTEIISGTNVYGTTGSFGTVKVTTGNIATVNTTTLSGTTIRVGGEGTLHSVQLGSATTQLYTGLVKAGSLNTSAGSVGFIKLGTAFAGGATGWYASITSTGSYTGFDQSYISGTRHTSGVNVVGAASTRYDWIAVGI